MTSDQQEPLLIPGALSTDDRGTVMFANSFAMNGVKRFFVVSNHAERFVRAWHAHRHETKYATVVTGTALFGAVKIDCWDHPACHLPVQKFVLSTSQPAVLLIPAGWASGFMSLASGTKVLFFSTATIEESRRDDYRYPARYWDIWNIAER